MKVKIESIEIIHFEMLKSLTQAFLIGNKIELK